MKIVHIAPLSPYNDYWGYQENLLLKYQRKLGHEVTLITTNKMHKKGKLVSIAPVEYRLADGQYIIRKEYKKFFLKKLTNVLKYITLYKDLCKLTPDYIFIHGLGNITCYQAAKYKLLKNHRCIIVADNHLDYNIGSMKYNFKNIILKFFYKLFNKFMQPFYSKVYGVTPCRKLYSEDIYGISSKKTDVLFMGADTEKIHIEKRDVIKKDIKDFYNIEDDKFLIVTGGKLEENKQIELLSEAVLGLSNVYLLIFGNIPNNMTGIFRKYQGINNICFAGWINSDKVYDFFLSADLVIFPGQHSVLWEQAVACGTPCIFKYYEGMDHVNVGGNALFLYKNTSDEIRTVILELVNNKDKYHQLKKNAKEKGVKIFSYEEIARKSLKPYYDKNGG